MITAITDSAKATAAADGGLALVSGFYVYVTVPYVYVAPIIGLGSCSAEFNAFLSYGGPSECNYVNSGEGKTCVSGKTMKDTMGDQGWHDMLTCTCACDMCMCMHM